MDAQLVALISVVTSGLVAITAAVVPFINERLRTKAQAKRDARQELEEAASGVLKALAAFRTGDVQTAEHRPWQAVYGELLTSFYRWRLIISDRCKTEEQLRLAKVGEDFERGGLSNMYEHSPTLAAEVHDLTRLATSRIR